MAQLTLIVMAAGIGSRYGGLKQIDPIGPFGELMIDYSIYDALKAGFDKVVLIIKKENETIFREKIGRRITARVETVYVRQGFDHLPDGFTLPPERKKPLGTAHAVLSCRDVVDTPFAVINADDFYGAASFRALADFLKNGKDDAVCCRYCMVGFFLENTLTEHGHVARGICKVDPSGYLQEIQERTRIAKSGAGARYTEDGVNWVPIPPNSIVSMNIWGFTPSIFNGLAAGFPRFLDQNAYNLEKAEYFLPEVVGGLLAEHLAKVKVIPSVERWYGVTYKEDKPFVKAAINSLIRQGIYPENLWGGR